MAAIGEGPQSETGGSRPAAAPTPEELSAEVRELRQRLQALRSSRTMRTGRAVLAPLRLIRRPPTPSPRPDHGGHGGGAGGARAPVLAPAATTRPAATAPAAVPPPATADEPPTLPGDPVETYEAEVLVLPGQHLRTTFRARGHAGSVRAALVTFTFHDGDGATVLPGGDLPMHPALGAYHYLEQGADQAAVTHVELDVPPGARTLTVRGVQWKKREPVHLTDDPQVEVFGASSTASALVDDYLRSVPADATLIVLDTTAPAMGHRTLSLRPNRLALEYEAVGHWVAFFPFGSLQDQESRVTDRIRQFPRSEFTAFIAAALERRGANNVYVCSSFPGLDAVAAVDTLKAAGWTVVYEVRDDMEEFNRVGYSTWFRPELEARVARQADSVVAVSPRLARKMDIITRAERPRAVVVPNAVTGELVEQAAGLRTPETMARREKTRKVGYVGHLTASWFDWPLLTAWAEQNPAVEVEIVGHGLPERLVLPGNVTCLGPRSHDELIDIVGEWKVGLIPFLPSPLTFAVDPNKIYEYLALGLRTVTAEMGAVRSCPATRVYRGPVEFSRCVDDALEDTADVWDEVESYLATATWRARAETMLATWSHRG